MLLKSSENQTTKAGYIVGISRSERPFELGQSDFVGSLDQEAIRFYKRW